MIRVLRKIEFNSHGQRSFLKITFTARDINHLDELLEEYFNADGDDECIVVSKNEPKGFGEAGGFSESFIDFKDENGNDCSELQDLNWYTGDLLPHLGNGIYKDRFPV